MNTGRALGVAVLFLGAILLAFGYYASDAPIDQIADALTGRYTDRTMGYLIAGIVAVVSGGVLAVAGRSL